ncbi:MAG: hypothetical protein RSD57_17360 [Comamonas sp.]
MFAGYKVWVQIWVQERRLTVFPKSGDNYNPINALQAVDGCLDGLDRAVDVLAGAGHEYRVGIAFERSEAARRKLLLQNAQLRTQMHRVLDDNEQLLARVESVRDVRLDLARAQMRIAQLEAQLRSR